MKLSDRSWTCSSCETKNDRDFNASTNIKNEGLRILNIGLSKPNFKPVESGSVDDKDVNPLKSNHSVKQENKSVRIINEGVKF